jgi:AraC-like DNA-binding protein
VVSISARSANVSTQSVNRGLVDLRHGGHAPGGSHLYEGDRLVTGWHSHDVHEIEYAVSGVVEVETAAGHYLLPPHQAAWIPAGLEHQTTINSDVRTVAVLFDPGLVRPAGDRVRILGVSPLVREMVLYGLRWPIDRTGDDPVADSFFEVLGQLVAESLEHEAPLTLPTSADPLVAAAIGYTRAHLATATAGEVGRAVGVSERTLRRHFHSAVGLSWRSYLLRARILRAMSLLAEPGPSVLEVSLEVGFESLSAFARAFAGHCGETPSAYRRRVLGR